MCAYCRGHRGIMKIAIINTGGTISCVGTPLAPMSAQAFAKACKTLIDETIIVQNYPNTELHYAVDVKFPESSTGTLDSTNLQPTDWCIIARYILDHYSEYDGWVVLHGTDSMDFTGTALPFLLSVFNDRGVTTAQLSKPVIITGSQLPMFYQGPDEKEPSALAYNTDAFQNFSGAIAAAQTGIPEVCVYFQNQLYRGNRVLKTNASEFNAFSSPNYPSLGEYGIQFQILFENILPPPVSKSVSLDDATARGSAIQQLNYVAANINNFPVMQFNAFPAWYAFNDNAKTCSGLIANLLNACVASGVKGLILESYGEGNFPSGNPDNPSGGAAYQALAAANASGVVIVDCTQVIAGVVNDNAYAAGAWLPAVGALNPADMTPMAAFAKLMILLTTAGYRKWTAAQVKTLMQTNLLGEMISVNKLDSRINPLLLANQTLAALDGSATLINNPVAGPVLRDSTGAQLWAAISPAPPSDQLPGRLIMQNDGNLVFYSRYNAPMWATNTGVSTGASSMLVLSGSAGKPADLALLVYDYDRNVVTKTLYQQK
ncbi:asparaginase domain-containing protein [Bradyrhizobium elkanii]|uniref:asparaginase domain-containing protein n=2 Tax=Bradyrhizobium elkanii TaxID=29448 RepID=UPI00216836EE|nr:asparaginase domain-containing protein [Bradyrhizobium elkanii]MCS3519246.1 L-asparaginase [Bradyrhizobium elkanii]MCS4066904.1 L-asparaginase [Bradyrhizobium elkanii]MCS4082439.1 L-asparaginase [Bradyrhizobium elkanii]MCW2127947.1 L-asparaginase [Bradyrhizobium elkanii]MCW2174688.1 L-asparaginase [Bradyrhizobium elkanii]